MIEPRLRLVKIFRFFNRWRTIDDCEAARLAKLARELKPHRTFGKPSLPKPVKPPQQPKLKPVAIERPGVIQRRVPSLHDDAVVQRRAVARWFVRSATAAACSKTTCGRKVIIPATLGGV